MRARWIAVEAQPVRRADPTLVIRARWLASEKLEMIIADRHSASRGYPYVTSGNYAAEPSVAGFAGFSRSVSVSETGADLVGAGTGYKNVAVSVSYTNGSGQAQTFRLATVLTEY